MVRLWHCQATLPMGTTTLVFTHFPFTVAPPSVVLQILEPPNEKWKQTIAGPEKYYHPTPGFNPIISVYPSGGLPFLAAMTTHQDLTRELLQSWSRGPIVRSWSRGPVVSQAVLTELGNQWVPRCHDLTPLYRLWLAHGWITAGPRTLIGRNPWPLNSGPRSGAGKIRTW